MSTVYIPLNNEYHPVEVVESQKKKHWSFILKPDLESCYLAHFSPCHVLGYVNKKTGGSYIYPFMCYAFIIGVFNYTYYVYYQLTYVGCPKHKTNTCLYSQSKKTCEDQYVVINNDNIQCIYNHDYNICIAGHNTCTEINNYNKAWRCFYILQCFCYLGLFLFHYMIRWKLKLYKKQKTSFIPECMSILCLFPCSLAQMYRESNKLDIEEIFV
tara:strand:+ start:15030 stop:15668 length:639 start_codon:yes stop_codon:yes gene_type:complete